MLVRNHAPSAEVSRVGVCQEFQNQGIAGKLLEGVMEELKNRGYKAVHLLVAKDNVKHSDSYDKLNLRTWESVNSGTYVLVL